MTNEKPSAADIAAEANYLRSQAIRQELESGERRAIVVDEVERQLPAGVQRGRPAFPMDDARTDDDGRDGP